MGAGCKYAGSSHFLQGFGTAAQGTCRIDDIVDEDTGLALDIANDIHDFGNARTRTAFFDDGNRRTDPVCQVTGTGYAAEVRRYDDEVTQIGFFFFWLIYRAMMEAEPR